ncbi:ArsR family transcriptional regulator [Corynebacterium yudongzhengii]|uniref:ArsR family transcriptional regulator n=1 Tax=Corynebacterium yudongzhengii TaxID=2080740 RepID=A0A2U1T9B9_9CORY|nr:winged helix-turn-helix domain-containing protein [Corynebacterium yudongzhengii]AWB82078.1 ArsR family transcriptional regulator [Corynebacterium yudongzhengii]PWC02582.1 ArsR family transcriptional regulator [Corynebacterium yudongzhengii]
MELIERLSAIEERLAALETSAPPHRDTSGDLWVLDNLVDSVGFAGDVRTGASHAQYQWQRDTTTLLGEDWAPHITRLAALAHPIRGHILRRLLEGDATVGDLVDEEIATSTGTAYHHLDALHAGGWVSKAAGGRWHVRAARVVPLLTIISATEDH